jgi:hypothetical protein
MPVTSRKEYPPYGYCSICDTPARIWRFNEEVVGENKATQLVAGDNACRECIAVAISIATGDID